MSNHMIRRVAVIVAMPTEMQHLPGLPPAFSHEGDPWPSATWTQHHLEITAVLCGIGMVRAAAATEWAIGSLQPDAILNFGCTGAHRADVNVGDVVIGTRSVQHASMVIAPDGTSRYDLHDGNDSLAPGATGVASDPGLLAIARMAARGWVPDPWRGGSGVTPQVHEGVVASADIWTQDHDAIHAIAARHQSLCEDMEAGAIAAICALHGVPFLTVKDISNNELLSATIFDPDQRHLPGEEVGRRAAVLTGRILAALAVPA